MKIYTKAGDLGETGLFSGARVGKDDPRIEAIGNIDELNSAVGLARALAADTEIDGVLGAIQDQLMHVGAELAVPRDSRSEQAGAAIDPSWIVSFEQTIDRWVAELPRLHSLILPGGSRFGAALHFARSVCRRAERCVVALSRGTPVDPLVLTYLNRLSDLLFVAARLANHRAEIEEPIWTGGRRPGGSP